MKWLHNLLKGLSLTTALFVFQACYGTPEWLHDNALPFKVVDARTGDPLEGVGISSRYRYTRTPLAASTPAACAANRSDLMRES